MNRRALVILGWVYVLSALAALVILSVMARAAPYFPVDLTITQAMQQLQSPALDRLALAIAWPGYVPQAFILLAVIGVGMFAIGHRWEAIVLWLASAIEGGVDVLIKLLVRRPRPEEGLGIHVYQPHGDFTYPSGHVYSYVIVFGLLAYFCYMLMKPSWLRTVLIVLLIALVVASGPVRIYTGAHWPSDVAAGYLLGSLELPLVIHTYHWGQGRFFKKDGQ